VNQDGQQKPRITHPRDSLVIAKANIALCAIAPFKFARRILRKAKSQVPRGFSLGSHIPIHKWGFSPWGMLFVCTAIIFPLTSSAHAQSAPCDISSLQTLKPVLYPPIGKVAHIQGTMIFMATFSPFGAVTAIHALSGPELLKKPATDAILTWTANPYTGPRECPLVIEFRLVIPKDVCDSTTAPEPSFFARDNQHFVVRAGVVALCDPPFAITKRHRFHIL
jgi:hypothetical protein